jgi:hypothetical protein
MKDSEGSLLHQQGVTVLGLLTGFMMTALVLILGSPGAFHAPIGAINGDEYFEILTTYVGVVGVVSIVGIVGLTQVGAGWSKLGSRVDQFAYTCFLIGLFGFTGALPLLLAPFTRVGAAIVLAVAVALFLTFSILGGFARTKQP